VKIVYTLHALERIRQRGIDRELIILCIQNPDKSERLENIYRCVKKVNDKVIVVFYDKKDDKIIVITAYLSSKIHKYLD